MDVKGLGLINIEKPVDRVSESRRSIKSDTAGDKDPNGQSEFGSKKDSEDPLSEEEIFEAFERLKKMPAIKDSTLSAELKKVNNKYFVVILQPNGDVVRRFPAQELSLLPPESDTKKGVLLNKSL